jgi:ABC-type transport system involved in multi-copper enzyme maturation permease subunit
MRLSMNPVIGRELTERMRGLRSFVAITIFVLILALTVFLVFEGVAGSGYDFDLTARTGIGRTVFEATILLMTALVLFFVPGLTAGAIAGERERQTLATLQVTMLPTRSILLGKIAAALIFLMLMMVAALPVLAVSYLLGGIRLADIATGLLAVVVVSVLMAAMVVAVSSFAKRVQTATLLAYGFSALVCVIGPLVYGIAMLLDGRSRGDETVAPAWLLTFNPFTLVADLGSGNQVSGDGPLSAIRGALGEAKARNGGWWGWFPERFDFGAVDAANNAGQPLGGGMAAWLMATIGLGALATILLLLAGRRLRTPAEVER